MARTQVSLDSELQRRARERAAQLGISFAEYVRRLVDEDLGSTEQRASPALVLKLGRSDGSNVARDKDAMIGEAVEAEFLRSRGDG